MHQQPLNSSRFSVPQGAEPGPAESPGRVEQEAQTKVRMGGPRMPVDLETGGASTVSNDSEDSGSARSVGSRSRAPNPALAGPGSRGWLRWFRRLRLGKRLRVVEAGRRGVARWATCQRCWRGDRLGKPGHLSPVFFG